jgi:hypothetical protein
MRILFFLFALTTCLHAGEQDPIGLFLTWRQDPARSIVVQWVTKETVTDDTIDFQPLSVTGSGEWKKVKGKHKRLPELDDEYLIHTVALSDLHPNTTYLFHLPPIEEGKESPEYRFKTMPEDLTQPVRFAIGGDIYHDGIELVEETNRAAAQTSPMFVVLGGDIAYAWNHRGSDPSRYLTWLKTWSKTMVTPEGNLIPLLTTIGNHDVRRGYEQSPAQAPMYYALFGTPGFKGHRVIDFGSYMSFLFLDSGHTHPIAEEQTAWLEMTLKRRQDVKSKFATYHVGAYPSYRPQHLPISSSIRKWWVPLFEKYGLTAAFENHDHTYKRTHLIKKNEIDPTGVLYMGDGCWGVARAREPHTPQQLWYLAKSAAQRHFILVTLTKERRLYQAISSPAGVVFDEFVQP